MAVHDEDAAAVQALGEDMAKLFNETPLDLDVCMVIALHHAVSAAAGCHLTKTEARANLMSVIDGYLAGLPDNFEELNIAIN